MGDIGKLIISIITFIIIFGCLLFLAYVTTKYIGQKASMTMKSKHMKVLETISLGMDKNIYLLQVGDKAILIGISGKNICYLTEVQVDLDTVSPDKQGETRDFLNIFSKYLNKNTFKEHNVHFSEENDIENTSRISENAEKIKKNFERLKRDGKDGDENNNDTY